jgi:hypothetical protein
VPKQSEQLHRDRYASRRSNKEVFLTSPSANALSGDEDPIALMTKQATDLVLNAIEDALFDPFWFEEYRHLAVKPRDDIADAPETSTGARIELNSTQPKPRVRFSLAHGIGETFSPEFALPIGNNLKISKHDSSDEWRRVRAMICDEQPHRKRPL